MKLRIAVVLVVSCLVACTLAEAGEIRSGEALLGAMHDRYKASWYDTVVFTQKSTTYKPDGTSSAETWYEAAMLPGKLRVDIGPPSSGNGAILADGTVTIFQNGKPAGTRPLVNMLLVLGFDVYRQSSEATITTVKGEGYDLTKVHEDSWEGQPVYVIGADKGDLKSKQFWVEKNRLLFVRLIEPAQADPQKTEETRFEDYRQVSPGWIAARVELRIDDKKVFEEEYSDIQVNAKLDPAVFDPKQFTSQHWEK
jgi:outer membrane lipoprotein-sorting protein